MLNRRTLEHLTKPVLIAALALQLGACASLGDDPFTLAKVDTGAPEAEVATTATGPADDGADMPDDVTVRHPNAVLAAAENDPLEDWNRAVFHINDTLDTHIAVPVAAAYREIVPAPTQKSIRSAFDNIGSPVTWANDILQGEFQRANVTFERFVINSTLGVAGFHDVAAAEFGLQVHYEDFDQTMALAGVESGPYLVVPLLGPATPRHLVGRVVDSFAHPMTWALAGQSFPVRMAPRSVDLISTRAEYLEATKALKANSPDYYAAVRSLYRQTRASEIGNGNIADDESSLDEDLDLEFE